MRSKLHVSTRFVALRNPSDRCCQLQLAWVMASVFLAGNASASTALPRVPIVSLSSGFNSSTNQPLPAGSPDTRYTLTAVPPESPPGLVGLIGSHPTVLPDSSPEIPFSYLKGSAGSRWLGIVNSVYVPNSFYVLQGNPYTFETSFELGATQALTAQIDGLLTAVDNKLIGIRINGMDAFTAPVSFAEEFTSFKSFPDGLGQGLFRPGPNIVEFITDNYVAAPSPLALRIEGYVSTVVPEPNGLLLCGASIAFIPGWRRCRGATRRGECFCPPKACTKS
jgi:hypothetical protein